MSERKPLTDEMLRILRAAEDGRLYVAESGRWRIEGEFVPDRRSRERLIKRGYLHQSWRVRRDEGCVTALGVEAIREASER